MSSTVFTTVNILPFGPTDIDPDEAVFTTSIDTDLGHLTLQELSDQYKYYGQFVYSPKVLHERMARDKIQKTRSTYCLLEESLILKEFNKSSSSALTIALGRRAKATLRTARSKIALPTELNKLIAAFFLPPVKDNGRASHLTNWLDHFTKTLNYDTSTKSLITTILCESTARRQMRRTNNYVIYCGSNIEFGHGDFRSIRPNTDIDRLDQPWGFSDDSSPTELCDCGECFSCLLDFMPATTIIHLVNDQ